MYFVYYFLFIHIIVGDLADDVKFLFKEGIKETDTLKTVRRKVFIGKRREEIVVNLFKITCIII